METKDLAKEAKELRELDSNIRLLGRMIDSSFQTIEEKKAEIRALKVRREYLREALVRKAEGRE